MSEEKALDRLRELILSEMTEEERRSFLREATEAIQAEQQLEFKYSIEDPWQRLLFTELARSFGLEPYRKSRQKKSTIMVRAPRELFEEQVNPRFQALSRELEVILDKAASEFICQHCHKPGDHDQAAQQEYGHG